MGARGPGGFENDTALDFVATVKSVDDLVAAFAAEPGEKIDADTASGIIAADECVAAMLGRPADDMPEDLAVRVTGFGRPEAALLETTRDHVSMVISHSELSELWADADNPAAFNLAMTGLIDRLNPEIKPKAKKDRKKKPQFNPSPCGFCNRPWARRCLGCSMFRSIWVRISRPGLACGRTFPECPTASGAHRPGLEERSGCNSGRGRNGFSVKTNSQD